MHREQADGPDEPGPSSLAEDQRGLYREPPRAARGLLQLRYVPAKDGLPGVLRRGKDPNEGSKVARGRKLVVPARLKDREQILGSSPLLLLEADP